MSIPLFGQSGYCGGPIGLGGKSITIPVQYPVNLQYVAQQVIGYLTNMGFQVNPMVGQNMVIIQARHTSLFGYLTDSNKAYTIRICQGPGNVLVETGIADWIQDLIPIALSGGFALFSDEVLHSKLLSLLGIGGVAFDAYHVYQQYAQEEQLLNYIAQVIANAPPAGGYYPQGGYYPPKFITGPPAPLSSPRLYPWPLCRSSPLASRGGTL